LINKLTFSDWFLKNKQIIKFKYLVLSILILIPSFDNKHTIHCLYRVWCICPISKKGKRIMSRGVPRRRQCTNTWSWKNEDRIKDKMCSLEKIRSQCFLLIYIYIYIYGYFYELKFSRYGYPRVQILWYSYPPG